MAILILGGTTEANQLVNTLQNSSHKIFLSLAGITSQPTLPPSCHPHIGGFGGVAGLCSFITQHDITAIIDATHPFAQQISTNATLSAQRMNIPLLRIERPQWFPQKGDNWLSIPTFMDVIQHLGKTSKNVFLTTGRKDLAAFCQAPQHHYVLRSIEPPTSNALPPQTTLLLSKPPFTLENEQKLMRSYNIDFLVTKNAGSNATKAKLEAAKNLNIPVIMIERPQLPEAQVVSTVEHARKWVSHLFS
ncbi:cobalt-precorrin-6A reductase [Swingsia samuiensis]|uniref:Cobalt-precorrin-6A reductase n=1 Tax=Swingsia samuiensis TaxID=1293412 RepID=A0A4Y6UL04_9PROT|nr:cobalt-precorrin-6A reductase [Swingsia samuiensis]QDH17754.1 cobalt-precorrin-6A reductase [Swingsia samuiensis]